MSVWFPKEQAAVGGGRVVGGGRLRGGQRRGVSFFLSVFTCRSLAWIREAESYHIILIRSEFLHESTMQIYK